MKSSWRMLFGFGLLLVLADVASGQVATGTPTFGSFGGDQDAINLANLNSYLPMPIYNKPGRGLPFAYSLGYNTSIWAPRNSSGIAVWTPVANWGFTSGLQAWVGSLTDTFSSGCIQTQNGVVCWSAETNFHYIDPSGTSHPFTFGYGCYQGQCSSTGSATASDGSGYAIFGTGTAVENSSGNLIYTTTGGWPGAFASIEDTNGNYMTATQSGSNYLIRDTTGQTALTMPVSGSGTSVAYTVPSGTVTIYYGTYKIKTNFGCSGVTEYGPTNQSLPYMVKLPDGTAYTFTYENYFSGNTYYFTGRVASIGLPNGNSISYTWTGGNSGINCADGTAAGLTRSTVDGTWTYSRSGSTTTVTAPTLSYDSAGNQTAYTFNTNGQETTRKIYQGSSTLLRTVNTTWASNNTPATAITILEDGTTQSEVDTSYNASGLLTSRTEYDWGAGAHGSQLRQAQFTYLSDSNTTYSSRNMMNLVSRYSILDGTGTVRFRKDIAYDGALLGNCPTGVTKHDDTNYGCSVTYRGNPTSTTTYLAPATGSQPVTKNFTFDIFGNELTAQLNCCQTETWTFSATTNYAHADSVTSGSGSLHLTTAYTYNAATGTMATLTDQNNLVTKYNYDATGRPTGTTRPDNISTTIAYNPGQSFMYQGQTYTIPGGTTVTAPLDANGHSITRTTGIDNSGRPVSVSTNAGGTTQYQYDALGRLWATSNPFTGSATYWTKTQFDALGRPTKRILPDGEQSTYSYSLQTVTVTDPSGKQRKGQADAAGRLLMAFEPDVNNGNALTQTTSYTYDVLDDLTSVTQGQQLRTYGYDAFGRLASATTPEGGTTCYGTVSGGVCQSNGYDSFDNLVYRTDSRGVVTNYSYDGLNRLIGVSYSALPQGVSAMPNVCTMQNSSQQANVCFNYDQGGSAALALGKLTQMLDPSGSETYAYDNLGRRTSLQKTISGVTYTLGYLYNYANELTQITYPSGRQVKPSYDTSGRLAAVTDTLGTQNTTYSSGFGYDPAQHVTGLKYGNGVYASLGFSPDRLQLNCLDFSSTNRNGACTHDGTTLFGLNYSYAQPSGNNGQIANVTDGVDNGRSANYTYDGLFRLAAATTVGSSSYAQWGLSWSYDRYGNRTAQTVTAGSAPANCLIVDPTTNHITDTCAGGSGIHYDAGGNMTNDGQNTLVYDGENRLTSSSGTLGSGTYVYDGDGIRVQKTSSGSTTTYVFSGSQVIAEYINNAAPSSPAREYIYSGTVLSAKIEAGTVQYYHSDALSIRLMTDANGNVIGQQAHYPFGEQWYAANTTASWSFTGYRRDSESNNDNGMAREYVNRFGRFSVPDSLPGSASDPQSLNKYPYTVGDPVNHVDPSGQGCFSLDGGACWPAGIPAPWGYGGDQFALEMVETFQEQTWLHGEYGPSPPAQMINNVIYSYTDVWLSTLTTNTLIGVDFLGAEGLGSGRDPIQNARSIVLQILSQNNPCSIFLSAYSSYLQSFNAAFPGANATAKDVFETDTISQYDGQSTVNQSGGKSNYPPSANTTQNTGFNSQINVNSNGPFFRGSAFISVDGRTGGSTAFLDVGGPGTYTGGSLGAQVETLLHELAHNLGVIPPDADPDGKQSMANTKTIIDHCKSAIDAATKK